MSSNDNFLECLLNCLQVTRGPQDLETYIAHCQAKAQLSLAPVRVTYYPVQELLVLSLPRIVDRGILYSTYLTFLGYGKDLYLNVSLKIAQRMSGVVHISLRERKRERRRGSER